MLFDDVEPPLVVTSLTSDFSENIEKTSGRGADAVEIRMDLYDGGPEKALSDLSDYGGELPVIATNRSGYEGGEFVGDEEDRVDFLERASELGCVEAVDVELSAPESVSYSAIEKAEKEDVSSIISYHDFETTPSKKEMDGVLEKASRVGDIAKLAVTGESRDDVLELLEVTSECDEEGLSVATMSMGSVGSYSRVVAPLYGSVLTYGCVDETEKTAPGQLTVSELRSMIDSFL